MDTLKTALPFSSTAPRLAHVPRLPRLQPFAPLARAVATLKSFPAIVSLSAFWVATTFGLLVLSAVVRR